MWETGKFGWDPDLDEVLEAELETTKVLVGWADSRLLGWREHMLVIDKQTAGHDLPVTSPQGSVSYAELVSDQR